MNIKELKKLIENLDDEMMVNISVKKQMGTSSEALVFVADEDKVSGGIIQGDFWLDGEFEGNAKIE